MDQSNERRSRNKKTESVDSDDRAVSNDLDQDIVSVDNFDRALAGLDLDETATKRDVANGNDLSRARREYRGTESVRQRCEASEHEVLQVQGVVRQCASKSSVPDPSNGDGSA
jgi:hypothetical protein